MNIDDLTIGEAKSIASMFQTSDIATHLQGKYVVVRTYSAGVHTGTLLARDGREVILRDARRIWYWDGAASISQLAKHGVAKPDNCKFSVPVKEILLTEAIEIIPCTEQAELSIKSVKDWTA